MVDIFFYFILLNFLRYFLINFKYIFILYINIRTFLDYIRVLSNFYIKNILKIYIS